MRWFSESYPQQPSDQEKDEAHYLETHRRSFESPWWVEELSKAFPRAKEFRKRLEKEEESYDIARNATTLHPRHCRPWSEVHHLYLTMLETKVKLPIHGLTKLGQSKEALALARRLSGRDPDPQHQRQVFLAHFTRILFARIHHAFMLKSDGKADEFGQKWKPLAPSTIARRALQPGERKKLGILGLGKSGRGLLTSPQLKWWQGIFRSTYLRLAHIVGEMSARSHAAKIAWGILKAAGAKTKIGVLGSRKVAILIDTHRLEESLRPGKVVSGHYHSPSHDQVCDIQQASLRLGTKVEYAPYVHKVRPLWPTGRNMLVWIDKSMQEAFQLTLEGIKK